MYHYNALFLKTLKIRPCLFKVQIFIVSIFLSLLVICVIIQVVARFLFNTGLAWTDEISIFSFLWASLIGAAIAVETSNAHLIDFFINLLPKDIKKIVSIFVVFLLVICLLILIKYGIDLCLLVHFQRSAVLNMPMSYMYACLPISALFMLVSSIFEQISK